jgi:hypothetical protein
MRIAERFPRGGDRVPVDAQRAVSGRHRLNETAAGNADQRQPEQRGDQCVRCHLRSQHAGKQGAPENGQKRAGFQQRVAAGQFAFTQNLRQVAVLRRPEKCRVRAHQEQPDQQQRQALRQKTGGSQQHDEKFRNLHPAHQRCLVELVGKLACGCREQQERQDEHAAGNLRDQLRVHAGEFGGMERRHDHQRVLENVVVECAERLGKEKGAVTAFAQQAELRVGHGRVPGVVAGRPGGRSSA